MRYRSQSWKVQGNYWNAQSHYHQRGPTPHRPPYSHFPLPIQTGWTKPTHSQTPQEIRPVHVDRRLWTNISETKNHSHLTPYPVRVGHSPTPASVALVQDIEGTQHPVYFVSRTLQDPETRYQMVEKLALSLVHVAHRLCLYFQNHNITVKID